MLVTGPAGRIGLQMRVARREGHGARTNRPAPRPWGATLKASMNLIDVSPQTFLQDLNRQPFGLRHALHTLPLFSMAALRQVAAAWPAKDFFVAQGAPAPGTKFYSTEPVSLTPGEAFDRLGVGSYRILLKRLERHAPGFRELLDALFEEVCCLRPEFRNERLMRLESFIFISSASTITPFHFDPEMNFFFQIAGDKAYHMYAPDSLAEPELERYYLRGAIDIGQVDFWRRRGQPEHRFDLAPGLGMHQPINAPHWVETGGGLSISYSFSVETDRTRAMGRTRAFNSLVRLVGMRPSRPGDKRLVDQAKAQAMHAVRPLIDGAMAIRRMKS